MTEPSTTPAYQVALQPSSQLPKIPNQQQLPRCGSLLQERCNSDHGQ